jgi:molecular chaperone GrpE (heat shock protein)
MEGVGKSLKDVAANLRENIEKAGTGQEIKRVIGEALAEMSFVERIVYLSEKAECHRWTNEKRKWTRIWTAFSSEIQHLITAVQAEICSLEDDALKYAPSEVRERLQNRKEGLEIICRMLERLPQRQTLMNVPQESTHAPSLKRLRLPVKRCEANFRGLTDRHDILPKIQKLLEDIQIEESKVRDANYEVVRESRLDAERLKTAVIRFFKDHLLPASDGLERGIWDEGRLREPLAPYGNEQELARRWFDAYHRCDRLLKTFMKKVGLAKVRAVQGMEFDPQWHTALGTEANSAFRDGQVLELLRSGWRLDRFAIRPAEVLVVRN